MSLYTPEKIEEEEIPMVGMPAQRLSEEEFVAWCAGREGLRAEWVEGEVIVMAPANTEHQDINGWLYSLLRLYVEGRALGVVVFDMFVRLSKERTELRVPDVLFVSKDRTQIVERTRVVGAPDLAIEIVSPDSPARDWRDKYESYESAGVREYWVIDPLSHKVEAYAVGVDGKYARIAEVEGKIASGVVTGWYLKPAWLWGAKRANVLDVLGELGIR